VLLTALSPWEAAFAFAHPVRARVALTRAVAGEPLSPSDLARELDEKLGTVSYQSSRCVGRLSTSTSSLTTIISEPSSTRFARSPTSAWP
jgi:hypothetical protein